MTDAEMALEGIEKPIEMASAKDMADLTNILEAIASTPQHIPKLDLSGFKWIHVRYKFIDQFGFAIPSQEMIDIIKKHSDKSFVSVGCGNAYLEKVICTQLETGSLIQCTDAFTGNKNKYNFKKTHLPIENIDAVTAILKYYDRDVLMSWPSYNEWWPLNALKRMRKTQKLFLVSEECCANEEFYYYIDENFERLDGCAMNQWAGIHDIFEVYKRK
jgi:hypothetical protein